jgi:hypothetical protein
MLISCSVGVGKVVEKNAAPIEVGEPGGIAAYYDSSGHLRECQIGKFVRCEGNSLRLF